jgi:hypothetical protein
MGGISLLLKLLMSLCLQVDSHSQWHLDRLGIPDTAGNFDDGVFLKNLGKLMISLNI